MRTVLVDEFVARQQVFEIHSGVDRRRERRCSFELESALNPRSQTARQRFRMQLSSPRVSHTIECGEELLRERPVGEVAPHVAVGHREIAPDHECGRPRALLVLLIHAVRCDHRRIRIRDHRKRQDELGDHRLITRDPVDGKADDRRASLGELFVLACAADQLPVAVRSPISPQEEQHDRIAQMLREPPRSSVLVLAREVDWKRVHVPYPFPRTARSTGLLAIVIVAGLLTISSDLALRTLKAPTWKWLQRLNYATFALVVLHAFFYGALLRVTSPFTVLLLLSVIAVSGGQALGIWLWRRRHAPTPTLTAA